ncbi:hypothetical protein EON65_29450 [archaeon]|nr:MAG: hypothetical protein EON65_29450 [archaeon]
MKMPSLSPTMTHGTIAKWLAKAGDELHAGDVVCEIETDKAAVAFEMQDSCVLAKILIEAQTAEVSVGQAIALTVEDKAAYEAFLKMSPQDYPVAPAATPATSEAPVQADTVTSAQPPAQAAPAAAPSELLMSPAARNLVQRESLDVSFLKGSGKRGMISKSDVISGLKVGDVNKLAASAKSSSGTKLLP